MKQLMIPNNMTPAEAMIEAANAGARVTVLVELRDGGAFDCEGTARGAWIDTHPDHGEVALLALDSLDGATDLGYVQIPTSMLERTERVEYGWRLHWATAGADVRADIRTTG